MIIIHCQECNEKRVEGWIHEVCFKCCEMLDPGAKEYQRAVRKLEEELNDKNNSNRR